VCSTETLRCPLFNAEAPFGDGVWVCMVDAIVGRQTGWWTGGCHGIARRDHREKMRNASHVPLRERSLRVSVWETGFVEMEKEEREGEGGRDAKID
jgi:hypothetical protein